MYISFFFNSKYTFVIRDFASSLFKWCLTFDLSYQNFIWVTDFYF